MKVIDLLEMLTLSTTTYRCRCNVSINRNKHQNALEGKCEFAQNEIDAILVDFINYVARAYCVDYSLEVEDIKEKVEK
jgi:hypothetical protein